MSVNISQISPTKNVSVGESTLSVTSMSVNISQISPTKNVSVGESTLSVTSTYAQNILPTKNVSIGGADILVRIGTRLTLTVQPL